MSELEALARKHAAEYFRIKKLAKQTQAAQASARNSSDCSGGDCGSCGGGNKPALAGATTITNQSEGMEVEEREEENDVEQQRLEETRVVETFRVLIFPDQTFKDYLRSLGLDYLRKEFRRLAILIHPDKNQHPHAKVAFQKLYNSFVEVSQGSN